MVKVMHELNPGASHRELAKLVKCSKGVVQKAMAKLKKGLPLEDAPKKGRPRKLEGEALERAIQLGIDMPVGSSRTVSEELASEGYPDVHASTLCRVLNRAGVKYGRAKRGFVITEKNRLVRLAFAATHGDGKTDFRRVMFTDSKIFGWTNLVVRFGMWGASGRRPLCPSRASKCMCTMV